MRVSRYLYVAVLCLTPRLSTAQLPPGPLTLETVLASARTRAPEVLIADAHVDETRSRLIGARVRFRDNPTVDFAAGPRRAVSGTSTDLEFGVAQSLETGGQRSARIAGAQAGVAADTASASDARRTALESAALAFFDSAYAEQRFQLLSAVEALAAETLRIAGRRFDAGDIAVLDVNLAKSALARTRSARLSADTERRLAAARLAQVAGLPSAPTAISGAELSSDRSADLAPLREALERRSDIVALQAHVDEALATARLGHALTRPDLGVTVRGKREGGDKAILAGLTVTWPAFVSGQEERAAGAATAARLRLELSVARASALRNLEALHTAYLTRREAAAAFEQEALPSALENERLSQRAFEEGELSLPDLLVVRRESAETRLEYLERLRDAAQTAMLRDAAAGVLR